MSASAAAPTLNGLLDMLTGLSDDQRAAVAKEALKATPGMVWVPNTGPQSRAFECEADELFYGGSAGGGKTDLVAGLSVQRHTRSLILRRFTDDARDLADRVVEIIGDKNGYNGQLLRYKKGSMLIDFDGVKDDKDKQRFKGKPHDLIAFDEVGDFLETQYRFITAWNRSANANQRCRVVCTGNPPTTPEGRWVIDYWGPWLDPKHPYPAEDGELRWYTAGEDGKDTPVENRGPHLINGETVYAKSRTFIRAKLDDNPDLTRTDDYAATLAALPPELRNAYRDGRFDLSLEDNPWQAIPTHWVLEAQQRWTDRPPAGVPMTAIGTDVAQGGKDNNVMAPRYDGWYAPLIVVPGKETPLGTDMAGHIVATRRNDALIVIDCGGGYGGSAYKTLRENDIPVRSYKGAEGSVARTRDSQLKFVNKRTEVFWRFREALDPSQDWGSPIALPPDPELMADLTAPTYQPSPQGIKLEEAEKVKARIGRSSDKGAAVVLAWSEGERGITHLYLGGPGEMYSNHARGRRPQVVTGRHHSKTRR